MKTNRERAADLAVLWAINKSDRGRLADQLERTLDEAVSEEREACAQAVLDATSWFIENTGRTASFAAQHVVTDGVNAIRARGAK